MNPANYVSQKNNYKYSRQSQPQIQQSPYFKGTLGQGESISVHNLERIPTIKFENSVQPMIERNKKFVGTLDIPGIARGTVCLLNNGQVMTCLHVVLDYNELRSGRLNTHDLNRLGATVTFVDAGKIYEYPVTGVDHSGIDKLRSSGTRALSFDFASLTIKGNPTSDLKGGLNPDIAHSMGNMMMTDPLETIAISGPMLFQTNRGVTCERTVSISENQSAQGSYYSYAQTGSHFGCKSLSGQAVLPLTKSLNSSLYALHSYHDVINENRTGVKISEYWFDRNFPPLQRTRYQVDRSLIDMLMDYEVLQIATRKMDGSVVLGKEVTQSEARAILEKGGDIAGGNVKEAKSAAPPSWGKVIKHQSHLPKGMPHFHHSQHTASSHPGHIFYPGAQAGKHSKK